MMKKELLFWYHERTREKEMYPKRDTFHTSEGSEAHAS
jgi:hypothetical protein